MDRYFNDLKSFAAFYQSQKENLYKDWIYNYLYFDIMEPLVWISSEEFPSSVIEKLFLLSNREGRKQIKEAIKDIYKEPPLSEFSSREFLEILKCIGLLNIYELLDDVYDFTFHEKFKNVKSPYIPEYLDLHTILLKTLFGLTHEKRETNALISLAKRDIISPNYMLECFNFLITIPKYNAKIINYIPLLLAQNNKDRDYHDVIITYLQLRSEEELIGNISAIVKILELQESDDLIRIFNQLLYNQKINIVEKQSKSENKIVMKVTKGFKPIPKRYLHTMEICFMVQENIETKEIVDEIIEGKGEEAFLNFLNSLN